ncbi:nodulation protein NodH [Pseudotabrizicola alkalilacus]|uniref:Nodulation protein NodH n=1 Tax=Pseudotabrizicola alkalilacus TaxID=2305252 RepID=A0A411Z2U0_9RHOB|nr:nodulation protein NodH [Pseudotabrizicola alkalilacus]RGP37386.1 nodulation protein NodH [Pseudotabrizicola alkalilacus]
MKDGRGRFDSFVMFAEMRTGSNFLESNLNAMPGVTCHGEVFNPYFIGKKDQLTLFGYNLADREADPIALIRAMRVQTTGLAGFRYFHDHDPRVLQPVLDDPRCAKIILTRNPVESYVSWKIAQQTGQWKLTNAKNLKTAQVRFDAAEFETHVASLQEFQVQLMYALQVSGQTAFYIDYEDINDLDVLNGLAAFLGAEGLAGLDGSLKKQNPEEIAQKVLNPDEMERGLARLDRFNLARTPNFEPRRAPMVPQFIAARTAGLLYMPVRGGPVAQVTGWLQRFGAVESDFTQKSLRQWKKARVGHRSFTVLGHPVARAHDAFCSQILMGGFGQIREQLVKIHKLDLPAPGKDYADVASHRAGFIGFLKWIKLNLSGQTSARVDAHWASQAAVLQGFATFQGPDIVLREERLAEGLAFLAAEVGQEPPAVPPASVHDFTLLAEIYDAEVEAVAREAYARDYVAFGFSDWQGQLLR